MWICETCFKNQSHWNQEQIFSIWCQTKHIETKERGDFIKRSHLPARHPPVCFPQILLCRSLSTSPLSLYPKVFNYNFYLFDFWTLHWFKTILSWVWFPSRILLRCFRPFCFPSNCTFCFNQSASCALAAAPAASAAYWLVLLSAYSASSYHCLYHLWAEIQ